MKNEVFSFVGQSQSAQISMIFFLLKPGARLIKQLSTLIQFNNFNFQILQTQNQKLL